MNTRRDVAAALLGMPALAMAAKPEMHSDILPFGEAAARIISYTLYAEARGEPLMGKRAVAAVIQTRARRSGKELYETCLQDKQFSCWNELSGVPDFYISGEGIQPRDMLARSDCYGFAWMLLTSDKEWGHYTHFYNPDKATPYWAADLKGKRTIGRHVFGYID